MKGEDAEGDCVGEALTFTETTGVSGITFSCIGQDDGLSWIVTKVLPPFPPSGASGDWSVPVPLETVQSWSTVRIILYTRRVHFSL